MTTLSDEWIHQVGVEAYTYLYPLVTMELTRRQLTNVSEPQGTKAPVNHLAHIRAFPPADFRAVVRPNFDTLYSAAFIDLRDGPMVLSVGAGDDDRYYELPLYDMWSDAFAVPGERTSGTEPGAWAIVAPGWTGSLPDGLERIDAPTPIVWLIGRTQTNGPADYPAVNRFQDTIELTPLGAWGGAPVTLEPGPIDPDVDMDTEPLRQADALSAAAYFDLALSLLAEYGPHLTDGPMIMRMRRVGLVAGGSFDQIDSHRQEVLADVPAAAHAAMRRLLPRMARVIDGWQMNTDTMGVYGNFYVKRAIVAAVGLGANSAEDAIYPLALVDADGEAIHGSNDYVLHFDADQIPPVDAFWSLTMYDQEGFQVANPLDRFAIGDRDALQYGSDGSLDLYLQVTSPGADREANWLPTTDGPLGLTLRLYSPKPAALDGTWTPPPIRKA